MNLQQFSKSSFSLLLLLLLAMAGFAQNKIVTGTVRDKDGSPLEGVTVTVKGQTGSVITDEKGYYAIKTAPGETITFTHIGFTTREVKVGADESLNVELTKNENSMDEVVVVGYGTQRKLHLTGAVATVDMKQLEDIPVGSMSAALRGQMPGVGVAGGFTRPGAQATITVRNPKFLSKDGGKTAPLYIIDDVMRSQEDFNLLDQSEIESISVLKDGAAAIYGIQGGNGVIVVKTKRGRSGAPKISYNGSVGVTDRVFSPKMMNGYEHAVYMNDYYREQGLNENDMRFYTPDELEHFKANNYNWLDMAWQKSYQTRHTLNVSGGSERATYFAGFTYNTQNGNFDGINYNKYTFRASTDIKLATGLKLGLSLSGALSDNKQVFSKQGGENLDNDWKTLTWAPQFIPPYVDGLPVLLAPANRSTIDNYHFFAIQNSGHFTNSKGNVLNFQGTLNYEVPFIKGLTAGLNFNKNISNSFGKQYGTFYNVYSFDMLGDHKHIYGGDVIKVDKLENGNRVRLNPSMTNVYQLNATLRYDRKFGKHQIGVLAAYEQSESHTDGIAGMVEGVIVGGLPNTRYATGAQTATESESETGRLAALGRLDYNYASKYLLQFVFRADASTLFAPENRWGYFPSVSAGWVISEEPFFGRALDAVNFLKIRGSLGWLGTDNTKPYQWLQSYKIETGKSPVFGGNSPAGFIVSPDVAMPNRNAVWDDVTKYNVGFDTRFLDNRLSVSGEYFFDKRRNMLTSLTSAVSLLVGANVPAENYARVDNFGYEISIGWRDNIGKDWSYNINTFLTWMDNKILLADFTAGDLGTYLDPTGRSEDMGFLGYHYLGMFRTQQEVDAWLSKNPGYTLWGQTPKPGMLYYQDVRGPKDASGQFTGPDGKIDEEDMDFLTSKASNHYNLGFNWGVSYKSLSLNVVMGMSFGGQDVVESDARKRATATSNRPFFWANHWTPENPNAPMPSPFYEDTYNVPSSFWFKSSLTARVSQFNLSYTLPNNLLKRMRMSSAKVFLVGINPFNLYNPYDYKDNSGQYNVYPMIKSYTLGLNVSL